MSSALLPQLGVLTKIRLLMTAESVDCCCCCIGSRGKATQGRCNNILEHTPRCVAFCCWEVCWSCGLLFDSIPASWPFLSTHLVHLVNSTELHEHHLKLLMSRCYHQVGEERHELWEYCRSARPFAPKPSSACTYAHSGGVLLPYSLKHLDCRLCHYRWYI